MKVYEYVLIAGNDTAQNLTVAFCAAGDQGFRLHKIKGDIYIFEKIKVRQDPGSN